MRAHDPRRGPRRLGRDGARGRLAQGERLGRRAARGRHRQPRRAGRGALHALQPGALRRAARVPARARRAGARAADRRARPRRLPGERGEEPPAPLGRRRPATSSASREAARRSSSADPRARERLRGREERGRGRRRRARRAALPHRPARPRLGRGRGVRGRDPAAWRPACAPRSTLPYLPGQRFEGTVAWIYPALSSETRTARVRIELPNPDLALRPDMFADRPARGGAAASASWSRSRPCCTPASAASSSSTSAAGGCGPRRSRSACAPARTSRSSRGLEAGQTRRRLGHLPRRLGEPPARGARPMVSRLIAAVRARNRGRDAAARRWPARCGAPTRSATRPLDAIPDLSDAQVIVFTEWPGRSPDLVEAQVTYPISATLLAAPGVRSVRGQSFFGALVRLRDLRGRHRPLLGAQPRARVPERRPGEAARRRAARARRPTPRASAGSTSTRSWTAAAGSTSPSCARSRTGTCATRSRACPAWREVASVGGFVRQYQVLVDPERLRSLGVSLRDVVTRGARVQRGGGRAEPRAGGHGVRDPRARLRRRALEDLRRVALRAGAERRAGLPGGRRRAAPRPRLAARHRRARRRGRGGRRHRGDAPGPERAARDRRREAAPRRAARRPAGRRRDRARPTTAPS